METDWHEVLKMDINIAEGSGWNSWNLINYTHNDFITIEFHKGLV